MLRRNTLIAVVLASLPLAGCGGGDEAAPDQPNATSDTSPSGGMQGMEGMPGMQGMDMSGGMMDRMVAHMERMDGVRGDSLRGMLQTHRQMVANMIAQMNREMREMNMPGDAGWNATIDSLRADLVRMPELTGAELERLMPRHRARIVRLMDMHEEMMAEMRE